MQYYKAYKAQKQRHYEQGYKRGVKKQYSRIYQDLLLTASAEAKKMAQAVLISPDKLLDTKSARFLGKQLHRLKNIQSGRYVQYWSDRYMENYIQAVKYSFGEDMAEDLRYVMDNLSSKDLDKLFSSLPALNEFYNLDKQDSATGSRKEQIKSAMAQTQSLSIMEDHIATTLKPYLTEEYAEDEE